MNGCYLVDHPPRRSQYRRVRRARPSGVTVLHTAESMIDLIGADTGAEGVARFICERSDPGSYHDLVDSDSAIHLVPYECEAYQDGTGTNPHALSISFAIRATDWPRLTPARTAALLEQGARAFARQQAWLREHGHPTTPLRRISRAQSNEGLAGFVTHGDRDPGRRSDPGGRPDRFPWQAWFDACRAATAPAQPLTVPTEDPDMRVIHAPGRATCLLRGDGRLWPLDENSDADAYEAAGVPVRALTVAQWDCLDEESKRIAAAGL